MSDGVDQHDFGAVSGGPDSAGSLPGRRVAKNYLAPGERRRLFLLVMPAGLVLMLALGWVERTWFPRGQSEPRPAQVDTRLDAVNGPRPQADELVIEGDPAPLDDQPAALLSASLESLSHVRDATFFRESDNDAWLQTWNTLRETGLAALRRARPHEVGFSELFGQPRSFRGRLVRMRGTFHRLEKVGAPANNYSINDFWQGWMEPMGGPASPVVVQCLRLPEGMPSGMQIDEPVEIVGYFFKNYAYNATDTIRVAPLIMTLEPIWTPKPQAADSPLGASGGMTLVMLATMAALVAATWLGISRGGRPAVGRATTDPDGLDESLANVKLFSIEESLRELARGGDAAAPPPTREPGS
ncbi:MAG: hypothetical protein K8S94_06530 [Planctomycetia bacterium]|nr:hypothetical protein [Planctomycetia bacterium]